MDQYQNYAQHKAILYEPQIQKSRNAAPVGVQKWQCSCNARKYCKEKRTMNQSMCGLDSTSTPHTSWKENNPCAKQCVRQPHKQAMEQYQFGIGNKYTRYGCLDGVGNAIARRKAQMIGNNQWIILLIAVAQQIE